MGNCQAIDAAALVIQHPNGRIERFYGAMTASDVMRMNPGHYVSLIIPLPSSVSQEEINNSSSSNNNNPDKHEDQKTVCFTRVKLLRPSDTLVLGHAYRLVTSQDVMKVLRAKKHAKTKRHHQLESSENSPEKLSTVADPTERKPDKEIIQAMKHERHRRRAAPVNQAAMKSKPWQPSLQSISEAGS